MCATARLGRRLSALAFLVIAFNALAETPAALKTAEKEVIGIALQPVKTAKDMKSNASGKVSRRVLPIPVLVELASQDLMEPYIFGNGFQ